MQVKINKINVLGIECYEARLIEGDGKVTTETRHMSYAGAVTWLHNQLKRKVAE